MAMTVNDLAKRARVPAHVVRYYTRAGLLRPRRDSVNRYHLYRDVDVTRLRFIRRAKLLGFTLADIGQILRDADRRRSPCPRTRRIIMDRLTESDRRLSALLALQGRMQKAIKVWRKLPDAVPDGDSICYLIEAVTKNEDLDDAFK
ncbi:MAG TPA: MerR family transcriptional regulator [Gammaproteobacteria bacterium]|jgi:DNA-binding transcriptional MerR regulator